MKIMNRVCAGVLACACVLCVSPVQAKGATLVKEGKTITESVKNLDQKTYKIVIKKDSYIQFKTKNCRIDSTVKGGDVQIYSPGVAPAAKGTYILEVDPNKKSGNVSFRYKIKGKIKESFKEAKKLSAANKIVFNKTYYGFLKKLMGVHYYKVDVPSAGKVKVVFGKPKKNYQDNFYCFTNDQKKAVRSNIVYEPKTFHVEKGTYYFLMMDTSWTYDYQFKLKFTK